MAASGARVRIYGDWDGSAVKRAQQDLSTFQRQATGFSGAIGKSFLGMGAAIGGAFAIGSVISSVTNYLQDAATAAMQDEKSMVALAKAMQNVNQGFANTSTEKFVSETMLATGTADDLIRNGLSRLISATGDAAKAQDLLTTALDISAATGRDVVAVSQALARASTGQVSALTRLGIPLDANIVKTKDFDAALRVLNNRFGGQAAAAADTYGGQLSRLQVAAGEAQETIGYALLDAVENVTDAFGGTGGFQEVILDAGQYAADLVTGLGLAVSGLADLAAGAEDVEFNIGGASFSLADLGEQALLALPGIGAQVRAMQGLAEAGQEYRESQEASAAATAAMFGPLYRLRDIAREAFGEQQAAAEDAEDALKAVREEVQRIQGVISDSQAMDNFRRMLRDLDETLEGNKRSLVGFSDGARENRDTLRDAFSDAATIVQGWVDRGKISADDFGKAFQKQGKKIVDQFVKDGFDREDVEAFLAEQDIWVSEIASLSLTVTDESRKLGVNASKGVASGIRSAQSAVSTAMSGTVLAAIQAAKDTAKIKSPSEVTRDEIGKPIVDGIIAGLDSKKDEVKSKAAETAQAMIDAASGIVDEWDAELGRLKDIYDDALGEFTTFKNGITADIFGRLDLGAAVEEASATGIGIVEAFKKQASGIGTFAQNLIDLTKTNLSQAAWQAVASLSAERGSELSAQMLGAQGQTIIDGVNQVYADVDTMATAVGQLAAQKWYGEGVAQAQATYEGFKANFGEGGPARRALENLMDRLASSLNRTSTITVKTVYEAAGIAGKRAAGGPVSANEAYLVGERGPEVLVMGSQSGTIIPNGDLPMASGAVRGGDGASMSAPVVINISAGMGTDGAEVGRQVVDALKAYSRRNGPLPLAVA